MTSVDARQNQLTKWLSSNCFAFLWRAVIAAILVIFLVLLARQTALRTIFPWDMHIWAESPFMTDMLKLEHGVPVYASPADVNSFVYSPALEYLTFAALKPFGVELDIRYCRLVIILIGIAAAGCGALAVRRLARSHLGLATGRGAFLSAWAALALVVFKNFTSDIPHPDSLHALHALLVLYLCFTAVETKNFNLALAATLAGGLGVLVKQTDALCAVGPVAAFAILNPWGWRRWFILAGVGAITSAVALWCLWMPQYARFYTFDLLSHQHISFGKLFQIVPDLLHRERFALVLLIFFAVPYLWSLRGAARRYLICAAAVGVFSGLLNTMAYIKELGVWNNLGILEIFLAVLIWPLVWDFPRFRQTPAVGTAPKPPVAALLFGGIAAAFVLLLVPLKLAPPPGYYQYCDTIATAVRDDVKAGRKVMVSHGAEFLIRADDLNIPRDRANSFMELASGNAANLTETQFRIREHYYDRVYLILDFGFNPQIIETFHQNYQVIGKIPAYRLTPRRGYASGYQNNLWNDCEILAPRTR